MNGEQEGGTWKGEERWTCQCQIIFIALYIQFLCYERACEQENGKKVTTDALLAQLGHLLSVKRSLLTRFTPSFLNCAVEMRRFSVFYGNYAKEDTSEHHFILQVHLKSEESTVAAPHCCIASPCGTHLILHQKEKAVVYIADFKFGWLRALFLIEMFFCINYHFCALLHWFRYLSSACELFLKGRRMENFTRCQKCPWGFQESLNAS